MDAYPGPRPPAGSITIEHEGADRRVLCLRGDVDTEVATRFTSVAGARAGPGRRDRRRRRDVHLLLRARAPAPLRRGVPRRRPAPDAARGLPSGRPGPADGGDRQRLPTPGARRGPGPARERRGWWWRPRHGFRLGRRLIGVGCRSRFVDADVAGRLTGRRQLPLQVGEVDDAPVLDDLTVGDAHDVHDGEPDVPAGRGRSSPVCRPEKILCVITSWSSASWCSTCTAKPSSPVPCPGRRRRTTRREVPGAGPAAPPNRGRRPSACGHRGSGVGCGHPFARWFVTGTPAGHYPLSSAMAR